MVQKFQELKYGEYLEWYNPETGEEAPFVPGSPTGGKPVENGDKYVIATKPQGLRMGQICKQNNRKAPNTTGTAENVYLPTVSQNSTSDNTVLNGYLGNNGVLRVRDSSLEITKEVEGYLGEEDYKDEEFDFELTMPSYANESVDAICIYRNDKRTDENSAQRWLIQPDTIDIVTTNEGFIQAAEVNPELPTTLATTDDGQYYIYVGNSPDEAVYHLYDETKDKELHPEVSDTLPGVGKREASTSDGSIEYYASVTLVPVADFEDGSYTSKLESYPKDDNFVICKLDATKDIESQITSEKYLTRTAYKTRTLNFDGEGKAQFQLKLKDGEGILLLGLDNGTSYTIKELLTEDQIKAGYRFDHAYNNADGNVEGIETDENGNPSASGTVDNSIRSRGRHFVNKYYMLNDLSVSKEVRGSDEEAENDRINETEWNFNIKLKFNDDTFIDDPANSDSIKVKYVKYKYNEEQQDYTDIVEENGELTLNKETTGRGIYTGTFALKHDEKITLKDILSGTEYEIKETNGYNNPDGYITTLKDEYGNVVNSPDGITGIIGKQEGDINEVDTNIQIQVVNFNPAEENLTIEKQVKGETADYGKDWEFDVILTPPADFRFDSTYPYTKTASDGTETNGNINIGEAESDGTYRVTVKLKHGEKIKIEGLPEGTTYRVVEKDANNNGYETDIPENAEGTLNQNEEMTFTNSLIKYYQMSLKKTVAGHNSSTTDRFKFKVTFTPSDGLELKPINYSYPNGTPDTGRLVLPGTATEDNDRELTANGDGSYYVEFELKHNDIIYFNNIIEGTTYKVEEELSQEQSGENGYEVVKPDNAEGELDQNNTNPNVEFVNIRYALNDLMISKNVEGEAGLAENREFNFKITFKPAEDVELKTSYPYEKKRGTVTSETGNLDLTDNGDGTYSANFKLRHDEHYTVKDIPERTQYWVEELDANQNGYETDITKGQDNGAYVGPNIDQDMEVEFTNRKIAYYPLTVEKVLQGDNVDTNREFRFRITLIPEEGMKEFKESYTYTGSKSGTLQFNNNNDGTYTAEVTLKGGENIKLDGIPEKTKYVVEELNANQDGYLETESNNAEGTLTGQGQNVRYTNIKMPPHSLTLSKETEGGASGNTTALWHFEVRLTPPIGQTLEKLPYTSRNIIEGVQPLTPPEGEIEFVQDPQAPGTYVATVQLLHGQSITINNIPTGTNYKVSETEANANDFVTYVQGDESGTIMDDVGIVVAFKNKKAAPMDLMIAKTVSGNRGDKTALWNFDIKLTPEENVNLERTYRYEGTGGKTDGLISFEKQQDGSYLGHVTLRHGETITIKGLPKGTKHEITEREANQNDYTTEVNGQTVGVLDENGKQIEFVNTKVGVYDLSIKKTVMGRLGDKTRDWRFQIVLNIPNATEPTKSYPYIRVAADGTQTTGELTFTRNALGNYEAETTLKHGDLITLQNILEGTQYTVTEPESNKDGYITNHTDNCQGTIVENGTQVEFVNRYLSSIDLTLQKVVKGEAGEYDRMWTYRITLDPPKGVNLNSSYHFSGSREGEVLFTQDQNGLYTGTIQIKHGETLTIEGLPEDTKYLVEEIEANTDGYTTKDSENTQGNLTVDTGNIVYTNSRLTNKDLTLEKIVEGRTADKNREWTFEVTLIPDEDVSLDNSYPYTGSKEGRLDLTRNSDGTYTGIIKLKHGEKITVQGIPEGTQYKVIEKEANTEGYETTNTNNTEGKLQGENMPTVTFKNAKLLKEDLTVTKTVQGMTGDSNRQWTFEIHLISKESLGLQAIYEYAGSNNSGKIQFIKGIGNEYIARVTLKHGEYITIKDLPEGIKYKVTEVEANQDGYTTKASDNYQGEITDSDITVDYINSKYSTTNVTYKNPKFIVSPRTSDNIKLIIALFGLSISLIVLSGEGIKKLRKNK